VASGAEEMGASIREIAQGALEASRMTATAVRAADAASATVTQLGEASTEIDSVLTVIGGIAEQTNLLALNATIEAARAGEAGKGFAVVAHEVKELARESAQATESIRQRVDGIQEQSAAAVRAIDEILRVIAQVDGHATTIATAVEEQTAVTQEMSRSVTEAATGAGQIAANIAGVAEAAATTTDGVGSAQAVAGQIEQSAHDLRGLVAQFRV
jgi:methyl-accepting chemotaxis protein